MSETIPTFQEGELVRAMQTAENEKRGIASEIGVVVAVSEETATVDLPNGPEEIKFHSLDHVYLPHVGRWLHNWVARAEAAEARVKELSSELKSLAEQVVTDIDGIEAEIFKPKGEEIAAWSSLANTRRWAKMIIEKINEAGR